MSRAAAHIVVGPSRSNEALVTVVQGAQGLWFQAGTMRIYSN